MSQPQTSITGHELFGRLREREFDFFSGVPCSLFASLYPVLEGQSEVPLIAAVREDEAVAHAAGAYLGGRKPVVLMQNSGLGNCLNAIVSLSQIYALPLLLLVSWRGYEGRDAPEHLVMGRAMTSILESIELPFRVLDGAGASEQLDAADGDIEAGHPTALLVKPGVIS